MQTKYTKLPDFDEMESDFQSSNNANYDIIAIKRELSRAESLDELKSLLLNIIYYKRADVPDADIHKIRSCQYASQMKHCLDLFTLLYGNLAAMLQNRYNVKLTPEEMLILQDFSDKLSSMAAYENGDS